MLLFFIINVKNLKSPIVKSMYVQRVELPYSLKSTCLHCISQNFPCYKELKKLIHGLNFIINKILLIPVNSKKKSYLTIMDLKTEHIDNKPPASIASDWQYFLREVLTEHLEIKSCYDIEHWKVEKFYPMRVSNIYDPSHFWVVSQDLELDIFHKYLCDFYTKNKIHYKIPKENLKLNIYCIVYTEGAFYRAILVKLPIKMKKQNWAFAYLIDFGFMAKVLLSDISFMTKKMYSVPQFAMRACLAGVCPAGTTKWTKEAVNKLNDLTTKKIVYCQLIVKNDNQKILFVKISELNSQLRQLEPIEDTLIVEHLAKKMSSLDVREMKHALHKNSEEQGAKIKFPFLYPTFADIEKANVDTFVVAQYLNELPL